MLHYSMLQSASEVVLHTIVDPPAGVAAPSRILHPLQRIIVLHTIVDPPAGVAAPSCILHPLQRIIVLHTIADPLQVRQLRPVYFILYSV